MRSINIIYEPYRTKVNRLYLQERDLNDRLTTNVTSCIDDIRTLSTKGFNTNTDKLIKLIQADKVSTLRFIYNYIADDTKNDKYELLKFKFRVLFVSYTRLICSNNRLSTYTAMRMPYNVFNCLNTHMNLELSKSILRGYSFKLGMGYVKLGDIRVVQIERKFDNEGHPVDRSINWDESKKFKQALIKEGIEVYNKETTPNGRKWFIYHDDPIIHYINWDIYVCINKFIKFFKFEPTMFVNTKNRVISDVLDQDVDIEDIINNTKLGFSTKLNVVLKHDPSYALKFRN